MENYATSMKNTYAFDLAIGRGETKAEKGREKSTPSG